MHALIELDTLTDRGTRKDFGADTPPDMSHKIPALKWVPFVVEATPAYDHWTEKVEKSTVVTATEVTETRTVVALSAEDQESRLGDYFTTSGGIKLKTDDGSQSAFSNLLTLLNESGAAPEFIVTIKDVKGALHQIDLATLRTELIAYGNHCYTQFLS